MCDFERSKIKVLCDKKSNFTENHCFFDTDELNRVGCEKGIPKFIYTNLFVLGSNAFLVIYIFLEWMISTQCPKAARPKSKVTIVQDLQKPSISSLPPSKSMSKDTNTLNKQHSAFSQVGFEYFFKLHIAA